MNYSWLKALHIIAVLTWVGGMLVAGVVIGAASGGKAALPATFVEAVRRWDRRVTSPAMLAVWALGLALAYAGSWFQQGWLGAKIAVVLVLSALHGMISGKLRRLAGGQTADVGIVARAPLLVLAAAGIIVALVVTKPF